MRARVKDVMTTRVVAVRKDATFKDIVALLTEHRVSAFPVLDEEEKVIGVVSEADLLSKEALVAAVGALAAQLGCANGSPYHAEFAKAAAVTASTS
jgi:CBS-domain-containing membrane protein